MGGLSSITGAIFGSGGKDSKQTSSVQIPEWLVPIVKPLYTQSAKIGQQIANQKYAPNMLRIADPNAQMRRNLDASGRLGKAPIFSQASTMGKNMASGSYNLSLSDPNYIKAQGYTGDVLSGKYMNNNPYLNDVVDITKRGVTDTFTKTTMPQVQANLARQNAFGGSGWMQANQDMNQSLAQELADAEAGLRYQNYGQERSYMDKAVQDAMAQQGMMTDNERANQQTQFAGTQLGLQTQSALQDALQQALTSGDYERGLRQQKFDATKDEKDVQRDWLFRALQGLGGGLDVTSGIYGSSGKTSGSGGNSGLVGLAGGAGQLLSGLGSAGFKF